MNAAQIRAAQEEALLAALEARPGASVYELSLQVPAEAALADRHPGGGEALIDPEPKAAATTARTLNLLLGLEKDGRARADRSGLHRWYRGGRP